MLSPFSLALFDNNKTFLFSLASCTSPPQTSSSSPSSSCWRRPFFLVRCPLSTRVRDGIQPTEMLKFHFNSFLFLLFLKKKKTNKKTKKTCGTERRSGTTCTVCIISYLDEKVDVCLSQRRQFLTSTKDERYTRRSSYRKRRSYFVDSRHTAHTRIQPKHNTRIEWTIYDRCRG